MNRMETLIINGGGALRGSVEINGAKNENGYDFSPSFQYLRLY